MNDKTVDQGIPLPPARRDILGEYAINEMAIGESVLFPLADRQKVQSAVSGLKRRTGKTFTVRAVDETNARIWRTS